MTEKLAESSDDAVPQQSSLSASALLKQHETTMKKAASDVKRSQQDTAASEARTVHDDSVADSDADTASTSAALLESHSVRDAAATKPELARHTGRSGKHAEQETLKQADKARDRAPELGRGLSVGLSGFVDLDAIPCSSTSSTVSCDSAKVR